MFRAAMQLPLNGSSNMPPSRGGQLSDGSHLLSAVKAVEKDEELAFDPTDYESMRDEQFRIAAPASYLLFGGRHQDYSGVWGGFKYLLTGGVVDGIQYSLSGQPTGMAPTMGFPPTVGIKGGVLKGGKLVQKMGRAKGNMSGNRNVQQEQFDAVVSKLKLNKTQADQLHDAIHDMGYGYQRVLQTAKDMFR